jgi:hypothetical protein
VEEQQSFVDGEPYEPTAESALAIKYRDMLSGRVQARFYGNNGQDCQARGLRQNTANGDIALPAHIETPSLAPNLSRLEQLHVPSALCSMSAPLSL